MTESLNATRSAGENPFWLQEFAHSLAFHPQFILTGNVRDLHRISTPDGPSPVQTIDAIWSVLEARGYSYLLVFDPVDRLLVYHPREQVAWPQSEMFARFAGSGGKLPLGDLPDLIRAMQPPAGRSDPAGGLLIDYASRIADPLHSVGEEVDTLFTASLKTAHRAQPRGGPEATPPPFNPVIWIADKPGDLPDWFRVGNESVRMLTIGLPDRAQRRQVAERAATGLFDYASLSTEKRVELTDQFVLLTEGLTLRAMYAVQELARTSRFGLQRIADAVRAYKVGSADDPWKDPGVRASIGSAKNKISDVVKGQGHAIQQTLDILKRSVLGLTGAHAGRSGSRPRGLLFFAGPTGVGKTELAKQITRILFGDETAYHRFDMSEFSAEHSEARLIGAPPGYVGHDAGGELVNAVRRRPFCVLLFDEIEKAHPRILDKFLQILEDGRLTDGRGDTVFFSEAVIIFTSNLGIYGEEERDGRTVRVQTVNAETAPTQADVEAVVRPEIEKHFQFVLQRPELLNRIGDNVVVFDFVREEIAIEILNKMLGNVIQRLREEQGLELELSAGAEAVVQIEAIDAAKKNGGRGIGNRLETCVVNPLARALFDLPDLAGLRRVTIADVVDCGGRWDVKLALEASAA